MDVVGNQHTDESGQNHDILPEDKLHVDSGTMDGFMDVAGGISSLETSVILKENQVSDPSVLAFVDKPINDTEVNADVQDAANKGILVAEAGIAMECLNYDPEIKNNDVLDEAVVHDTVEMLSPVNGEMACADTETNMVKSEVEESYSAKVLSPMEVNDDDAFIRINEVRFVTEEFDASEILAKGEAGDSHVGSNVFSHETGVLNASEITSQKQNQDNCTENRTGIAKDEAAAELNSPPILSKCTSVVGDVHFSAENTEGQRESKRLAELRERKRSKYLSPPYVNLSKGVKGADPGNSDVLGDGEGSKPHGSSPPASKSGTKKKGKKSARKSAVSSVNLQEITASSGALLSELHLAALNCVYACGNKHFEPTEIFFTIFRSSIYHDELNSKANEKVANGQNEKESVREAGKDTSADMQVGSSGHSKSEPKKRKKKEKAVNGSSSFLPPALYDVNVHAAPNPSFTVTYSPLGGLPVSTVKPQKKKQKKVAADTAPAEVPKPTAPNALDVPQDDRRTNPSALDFSHESNQTVLLSFENKEAVSIPNSNGNSVSINGFDPSSQPEGPFVLTGMPGPKKRGRKKGTVVLSPNPDGNPEKKKRRRKCKDGTYKDDLHNVNSPVLNANTTTHSQSISLEVCLRNLGPSPPAPNCQLNTNLSPGSRFLTKLSAVQPVNGVRSPSKPGAGPPSLAQIKQNLEVMTSMLEKSGDNVSPDTKAMLESEIRGLLKKVSTMPSSSS
ncbi:hypothetical protein vseg_012916 [Gypsophila vaccaria]